MSDYLNQAVLEALGAKEKDLIESNPWILGSAPIRKLELPTTEMSTKDAILYSLAKGAIGGGLAAYGRKQANDEIADYSTKIAQAPDVSSMTDMLAEDKVTAPIAAKMKVAEALQARADKEALDKKLTELAASRAAITGALSLNVDPNDPTKIGYTYKEGQSTLSPADQALWNEAGGDPVLFRRLKMEAEKGVGKYLSSSVKDELQHLPGEVSSIKKLADDFRAYGGGWVDYKLGKQFPGSEAGGLSKRLELQVKTLTKAIEGARPSDYDAKTYNAILSGNWTTRPESVAKLLDQAANLLARKGQATITSAKMLAEDPEGYMRNLGNLESSTSMMAEGGTGGPVDQQIANSPAAAEIKARIAAKKAELARRRGGL